MKVSVEAGYPKLRHLLSGQSAGGARMRSGDGSDRISFSVYQSNKLHYGSDPSTVQYGIRDVPDITAEQQNVQCRDDNRWGRTPDDNRHEAAAWIVQIQRLLQEIQRLMQQSDSQPPPSSMRNLSWHSSSLPGIGEELLEAATNKPVPIEQCPKDNYDIYAKPLYNLVADNLPAGEMICVTGDRRTAELRQTTTEQLLHLGTRQVVYLKAGACDDGIVFVIYGADGSPIVMINDLETEMGMVVEQGLIVVAVH
jgi:hypothetical protein